MHRSDLPTASACNEERQFKSEFNQPFGVTEFDVEFARLLKELFLNCSRTWETNWAEALKFSGFSFATRD